MDASRSLSHAWEEEWAGAGSRTCKIRKEDGHMRRICLGRGGGARSEAPKVLPVDLARGRRSEFENLVSVTCGLGIDLPRARM